MWKEEMNMMLNTMTDNSIDEAGWIGGFSDKGHAGPGWYIWSEQCPDEGSNHFATREEAIKWAHENPGDA